MKVQRQEFQKDLLQSVNAVKMCVTAIQNENKNIKLNPKKAQAIKIRIAQKQEEVKLLLTDVKQTFEEVGLQLKN